MGDLKMNEKTSVILIFLIFCSCNFQNSWKKNILKSQAADTLTNSMDDSRADAYIGDDSIASYKIDGVRQLSFKFNVDTSGYLLKSIIVYSDKIPIQIISANKSIEKKDFQLIDWNFDGYKDITARYNCGSGGCAYWIWNYSKESGEFYYNEELSDNLGLGIDSLSKYIIYHYRAGFSEENWDTLQYQNNKLSFVKGLYIQRWGDTLNRTWAQYTHTKMVTNKLFTTVDSPIVERE